MLCVWCKFWAYRGERVSALDEDSSQGIWTTFVLGVLASKHWLSCLALLSARLPILLGLPLTFAEGHAACRHS